MPKNENQKLKLFRIFEILLRESAEDYGVSMSRIISRLAEYGINAERKSIYDDFRALEELGFPVMRLAKRPPEYTLTERIFELPELILLVDAIESSKFITAEQSRVLIKKLGVFAGERTARKLSRSVFVDDRVKTVNKATLYSIDCIHEAINSSKKISFTYFDYDIHKNKILRRGGEKYLVLPKALVWNDENYYLTAFDERDMKMKNFRVDKMSSVSIVNEPPSEIALEAPFNPAEYSRKVFGMYGGREELVTLEFAERLAGVMIDRFGADVNLYKADSACRATVRVMISPTFFSWVFSFGKDMRIVSPVSVKEEYERMLAAVYENQKEN